MDISRRLGHEHEALIQTEKEAFICLDRALDTIHVVVTYKILRRHDDLFARESFEHFGNNMMYGSFVVWFEFVFVFGFKHLLGHIQVDADLLIELKLHDNEWVPGLALAKRRIQAKCDESMGLVVLGEDEEFFDGLILDFVIVGFAS